MSGPNGILLVDKPADWTSHDVVARVRRLAGTRKVGHAGTLDPMATGVLVLGLGASTRLLTYVVGSDKEYLATIRLGASTTTDDAEGETLGWAPAERVRAITPERLADAVTHLTGELDQVPSSVSAVKVDGKRSYARVRAGEQVELKPRRVTVRDSFEILIADESDKLIDSDQITAEAVTSVQNNGIVFLDEIDKICSRGDGTRGGADVSREGVQRDLLPLIEGTTVTTKHGPVKTDHILFIASGAFHVSKPSDLLPELQGRLPIRVELNALTRDDMKRILTEPQASLIKQYVALMETEGVTLEFKPDAIDAIADAAVEVNSTVENIGARRLQTVLERVLDDISFEASDRNGQALAIDGAYVTERVGQLSKNADLSRFIL